MGGLALVPLFLASIAAADQLQALLPISLGARVVTGAKWDGVVIVEPYDHARVRLTVERWPKLAAEGIDGLGASCQTLGSVDQEALQVEVRLPLPPQLERAAGLPFEARLSQVVSWVSQRVRLVEEDRKSQDARSVFFRRQGRCSGRANVAVALLRQLGVPARVVHGLLFRPEGPAWHRWGEAWIPGLGWRPFDPGVAVGVLGVRYVPMTGAGEGLPLQGIALLRVEEREFLELPQLRGLRVPRSWAQLPLAAGRGRL